MGWAYCGKNEKTGAEMGYGIEGVCDFEGCDEKIDHGLAYVCGGMHEGGELGCGRYFCEKHLNDSRKDCCGGWVMLCAECAADLPEDEDDEDDEECEADGTGGQHEYLSYP